MTTLTDDRGIGSPLVLGLRRFAPWAVLAVIALVVLSIYTGYEHNQAVWEAEQNKPLPSQIASASAAAKKPAASAAKPAAGTSKAAKVVVVSSVTLRKDPSSSAQGIRDLKSGDEFTLVGQAGSWYKVSDAKGVIGWVSASEKYTKLVK